PGAPSPNDFSSFVNYLYYFLLTVGAMIASLSLIYGGVIYFFSKGNPGKTMFARQQIFASFTGLGILLMSFIILNFLNPNLNVIKIPDIPTISGPGLEPIVPLEDRIIYYWELPTGALEDDVLKKTSALMEPTDLSQSVEDSVKELEQEMKTLENLLQSCQCSNLFSYCNNAQCGNQSECINLSGGTASQADLCPNLNMIQTQRDKINVVQNKLALAWKTLQISTIDAKIALIKLNAVRSLLKECLTPPMDLKTFLGIQDVDRIEKKIFFDSGSQVSTPIDCNQSAPDIILPKAINKQLAHFLAINWCETADHPWSCGADHVLECYNDTVGKSLVAGINPAFALVIWLNESNASNYSLSADDFGIHNPGTPVVGFTAQINRFLSLFESYKNNFPQCFSQTDSENDMTTFLRIFRAGDCINQAGLQYAEDIKGV
ncbi:MAG: hypothetical protein COY04_00575, partial [Parcubacteria group bacterium CG_4_10_14_0_2_um_filter_7_35_8]